jgi:hypothetical protein
MAQDFDDAGSVKDDASALSGRIRPQVEELDRRGREHVMEDEVVIRELDSGPDEDGQDGWLKLKTPLIDDGRGLRGRE